MRLLLWVLPPMLSIALSSCAAASADSNERLVRAVYSTVRSRDLATDDGPKHTKRFLRGESSKIVNLKQEEGVFEERKGVSQKLTKALQAIKARYLKWEQKVLVPGFKKMAEKGVTYSELRDTFRVRMMNSGRWGTPSGFKRYARLYSEWLHRTGRSHLAK
uniref:RxLR effector protein n=1 Tax=Phytophthora infestans TaxID=4787 RepID=A0A411J1Y3_PHYIN|nr:effector protein [Phytophthora infestans]QBC18010.1 effector protein [Phytophthora infestans]